MTPTLSIVRLPHGAGLPTPAYKSDGAAGLDLHAAVEKPMILQPGQRAMVPTGIRMAIPHGFEGQVRPRSGSAASHGVTVLNAPGTIDSDYRGEVQVILINQGAIPFPVKRGDRIAQLVVAPVSRVAVEEVDSLDDTVRGSGGFGSTGT